jgi:isoquinoline 1-oxidoreductase subunit beta
MVYGSGRYTDFASVLNPGLHGTQISFKNGRVERTNFDSYEVTRIDAAPQQVRTHLINTTGYDKPLGGVGEPGLPPVAPALANAIYAACGKRIRALPIGRQLAESS